MCARCVSVASMCYDVLQIAGVMLALVAARFFGQTLVNSLPWVASTSVALGTRDTASVETAKLRAIYGSIQMATTRIIVCNGKQRGIGNFAKASNSAIGAKLTASQMGQREARVNARRLRLVEARVAARLRRQARQVSRTGPSGAHHHHLLTLLSSTCVLDLTILRGASLNWKGRLMRHCSSFPKMLVVND